MMPPETSYLRYTSLWRVNSPCSQGLIPIDERKRALSDSGLSRYVCPAPLCHESWLRLHNPSGFNEDSETWLEESCCGLRIGMDTCANCSMARSRLYPRPPNPTGYREGTSKDSEETSPV